MFVCGDYHERFMEIDPWAEGPEVAVEKLKGLT